MSVGCIFTTSLIYIDLVPRNQSYVLVTLLIILIGLVLTTTCIDVVGAYYIDRLHFFGRRIDRQDPLAWLKAVQLKRIEAMKREAMRKLFETVTALHYMRFSSILIYKFIILLFNRLYTDQSAATNR